MTGVFHGPCIAQALMKRELLETLLESLTHDVRIYIDPEQDAELKACLSNYAGYWGRLHQTNPDPCPPTMNYRGVPLRYDPETKWYVVETRGLESLSGLESATIAQVQDVAYVMSPHPILLADSPWSPGTYGDCDSAGYEATVKLGTSRRDIGETLERVMIVASGACLDRVMDHIGDVLRGVCLRLDS